MKQRFECTTGGSNKFYEFETIRQDNGRITVNGYYGAIGKSANLAIIYDGTDETEAQKALEKKVTEKLKKRYVPVGEALTEVVGVGETERPSSVEKLPVIWPMAAQGIKTQEEAASFLKAPNYFAQEKLDGMRAIVHITENGLRIFSRSSGVNDPTRPLEKTASLPHLAVMHFPDLVGTILDGELMSGKPCSVLSRNGNAQVKFFCFDLIALNGTILAGDLERRIDILETLEIFNDSIVRLPYARTTEEKENLLGQVVDAGGEGLMFKNVRGGYIQGARPSGNWYKLKKSSSWDCIIMGFEMGKGAFNTSQVGAIIIGQFNTAGELVKIGKAAGLTRALSTDMAANPDKYKGRVIEVVGQERFKSGAIRHPKFNRFRDDKNAKECIWYGGEQ